jgi:succinate dehydrogenase (ubiquinone) membrane anchor subunit
MADLAVPVSQGSYLGKASDIALGIAIPVHSHIAINSVLSDYVPKSVRGKGLIVLDS